MCRKLIANHNHRPCRWYAQAPLGPFTSRAYRLIEFSFACVFCPTTADAVMCAPKAPSDEGAGFCEAKDWGREFSLLVSLPPSRLCRATSGPLLSALRTFSPLTGKSTLIRGRLSAAAGLCIAKAFWNHRHSRWYSYTIKRRLPYEGA